MTVEDHLPALVWQPARRTYHQHQRLLCLSLMACGVAAASASALLDLGLHPAPLFVWNASASAPIGLWSVTAHADIHTGDMVVVPTPLAVRNLAAIRGYIPARVPLLKRVVAQDGDTVCANGPQITLNGQPLAVRKAVDHLRRPLPWWQGCVTLRAQVFLLTDAKDSFDGRYFGPVPRAAIIGKATPLWLR